MAIADVLSDRGVEQNGLLTDYPDVGTEPLEVEVLHILTSNENLG